MRLQNLAANAAKVETGCTRRQCFNITRIGRGFEVREGDGRSEAEDMRFRGLCRRD